MDQNTDSIEQTMELEKLLHYRVQRLASKMALITSREVLAGSGIHIGEWRLICLLNEHGEANHSRISQRLALDPGRTSRLLKAAEKKGLVRRTTDPTDGRASIFELTPHSIEALGRLWPLANAVASDFHRQFAADELEQLNTMLDKAIAYANLRLEKARQS